MSRRDQYSLLVVRGDGARIVRLTIPKRLAIAGFVVLTFTLSALAWLVGDYLELRQVTREARGYVHQVAQQREIIDRVSGRIADLQREASAWRELHARIWEAMGPETTPVARLSGIGGAPAPVDPSGPSRSASEPLEQLADRVKEEGENLQALDRVMARAGKVLAALPSRWPVRGAVNSEFGTRLSPWTSRPELHSGIDIGVPPGTPVRSPSPGTVAFAGDHGERGLVVLLDHGHDVRSHYGHLSRISVKVGQRVERDAVVGFTGSTGRSTGPHLHYEILVNGRSVNPRAFLWD